MSQGKDPHDRLARHTLAVPENVEGVLYATLPAVVLEHLDLSTLRREPGTYVDRDGESRTDLLFSVAMGERRVLIYVLLEHQSKPQPDMPVRMLHYMARIWRELLENGQVAPLPVIVPVVLHHGAQGWTMARQLGEMLDWDEPTREALGPCVPDFELLIDDLTRVPEADLLARAGTPVGRLVVWVLRAARTGHEPSLVEGWAQELNRAAATDSREALGHLMEYLANIEEGTALLEALERASLSAEVREDVMGTYQQKWFEKGEAKGKAEGRAELLLKQLHLRLRSQELPEAIERRVREASIEELDLWGERVLSAETLDDVFS